MIVKNESANMVRLLDSLYGIINMACITDTGSDDQTKEIIEKWFKDKDIPLTLIDEPFLNFGHNRTKSLQAAKKSYPETDYFLLSDADFVWKTQGFDSRLCIDDAYTVEQGHISLSYRNIRLLSNKLDWACIGVTHEYWEAVDADISNTKRDLKTLCIVDMNDGGSKSDKFTRDEMLLKRELEKDDIPSFLRTRYQFYLGNTLKTLGKYEEAIDVYGKRIERGGFHEEIFHAMMEIGYCYESMFWKICSCEDSCEESADIFNLAITSYRNAHIFRPCRAESLYRLANLYRKRGMNEEALDVAIEGSKIPYPETDILFISDPCYDYEFDVEISICAFYVPGRRFEGVEAIVRLFAIEEYLPRNIFEMVKRNSVHYL